MIVTNSLYHSGFKCPQCGIQCPPYKTKKRNYCSDKCARKSHRIRTADHRHKYWKEYYLKNRLKLNRKRAWRFNILKRDNFTCRYCGSKAPEVKLEVDHINPKSRGGENIDTNYITSCWECNRGKHATIVNI